jgi:hypothetical protein
LYLSGVLRIRWFDPIAEASELPDHFPSAPLLRLFGDGWASLFVTNSLVQEQADQATLSMGNGPDGLLCPRRGTGAAIDNFEDTSFGLYGGVRSLIEYASHVAVALGRPVAVVHPCALFVAGAGTYPRGETFLGRKGCCGRADFGNVLLC